MDTALEEPTALLAARLVESERESAQARHEFRTARVDRVAIVRQLFRAGKRMETSIALGLVRSMPVEERQQLLEDLLRLSFLHGLAKAVREIICSLSRPYVLATIEALAEPHLNYDGSKAEHIREGTEEEYRRLLELYILLDRDLTLRLARRAAAHADPEIAEAGNDFLEKLAETNGVASGASADSAPTLP